MKHGFFSGIQVFQVLVIISMTSTIHGGLEATVCIRKVCKL